MHRFARTVPSFDAWLRNQINRRPLAKRQLFRDVARDAAALVRGRRDRREQAVVRMIVAALTAPRVAAPGGKVDHVDRARRDDLRRRRFAPTPRAGLRQR